MSALHPIPEVSGRSTEAGVTADVICAAIQVRLLPKRDIPTTSPVNPKTYNLGVGSIYNSDCQGGCLLRIRCAMFFAFTDFGRLPVGGRNVDFASVGPS